MTISEEAQEMEPLPKQKIERILFAGKLLTDMEITMILNEFEKRTAGYIPSHIWRVL